MNTASRQQLRFGVVVCLLLGVFLGGVALLRTGIYGWTLFVLIPVVLGGISTFLFRPATAAKAELFGAITVAAAAFFLLFAWLEGILCIVMSLPLLMPLGAFGGWLAFRFSKRSRPAEGVALLLLLSPGTLAWDVKAPPPVYEVKTAITVAASPEQVWKRVVSFPELPEPAEWYFRDGIAYPIRAHIDGSGPGAVRYCEFSTGPFVEPIEVWDEPHRLAFSVTQNPPPMREWSPYGELVTKHLHGYLISKHGQFRLTPLPDGRTVLEGTTWYQHNLWPAWYWRFWSDGIIHRIHLRVLNHIRVLAEQDATCQFGGKAPASMQVRATSNSARSIGVLPVTSHGRDGHGTLDQAVSGAAPCTR
jgi:hypothetical protein